MFPALLEYPLTTSFYDLCDITFARFFNFAEL